MGKGENMKKKQPVIYNFAGNVCRFCRWFYFKSNFSTKPAFAKKAPSHQKVVIAEEFRVVDIRMERYWAASELRVICRIHFPKKTSPQAPVPQLRLGQESGFQIILSAGAGAGSRIIMKDKKNKTRTVIGNTELYIPKIAAYPQASSIFNCFVRPSGQISLVGARRNHN